MSFDKYYFKKCLSSPEDIFFIAFRKREREREKHQYERETTIGCLLYAPVQTGYEPASHLCPDQESNPEPPGYRAMLRTTEPHRTQLPRPTVLCTC